MRTRRGSDLWSGDVSGMICHFEPGDVVIPVTSRQSHFLGVVKEILPRINKIMVLWNGGSLKQHDPDEILLEPHQSEIVRTRMASSRRVKGKAVEKIIAAAKREVVKVDWNSEKSIKDAEREKSRLENQGYALTETIGGVSTSELVYTLKASENFESAESLDDRGCRKLFAINSATDPKMAARGPSAEELYRKIRNGLLSTIRDISRKFPDVNLRYSNRELGGTVAGHSVKVFYDIYRASNGEVAGLPVIIFDGQRYDKFYRNVDDKLQELIGQPVAASEDDKKKESEAGPKIAVGYSELRSRRATGEMSRYDIQPGGEHYEWAKIIENAAKEIQRFSRNLTRFKGMVPFDVYQGPYAQMNNAKLWSTESEGIYFFELFQGGSYGHRIGPANPNTSVQGSTDQIADWLVEFHKKNASSHFELRSRRAMYWGAPDRVYRLTRNEQENGNAICPRCKKEMNLEPFTKSDKLYTCQSCGFKVPTSKTTTTRVTIDVDKDGEVDVDVKTAEKSVKGAFIGRRCRKALIERTPVEIPANLSTINLSEIAYLIYQDHEAQGKAVNYAAKPYLEAMSTLKSIKDNYMLDSGSSIVAYLLGNLTSWRGDVARAVKNELNRRLRNP